MKNTKLMLNISVNVFSAISPDRVLYFTMDLFTSVTRGLEISPTQITIGRELWDFSETMKVTAHQSARSAESNSPFQM